MSVHQKANAARQAAVAGIGFQSVFATTDGLTTGMIDSTTTFASCDTVTDGNKIVTLPRAHPGQQLTLYNEHATLAIEIRTRASSGIKINNVDSDGTQELAFAAGEIVYLTAVSATEWRALRQTIAGAATTAVPN